MYLSVFYKNLLKPAYFLVAIVFLGAILRLWGLGSAEIFHDEGFYAFRSIGYIDYLQNADQTTPMQWFRESILPWWTGLSFHDHPPFFFIIQHLFFVVLGDTLFAARLPSVLAGLGAIVAIYFLARKVFSDERAGLLAALLLAINHVHVWISRSSLMESTLIALIILNVYLFIKFIEDDRHWFWFGVTLGLASLTKYTAVFLLPVYFVYLLFFCRGIFKSWRFYVAASVALALFSPVLVYNFYLWKSVGHFDLQFSYLFRQITPEWRASLGKIQDPFTDIGRNLAAMYSLAFLMTTLGGLIYSVFLWRRERNKYIVFGWLLLVFLTVMLVPMGSAYRFIALYAPVAVFFVVAAILLFYERPIFRYATVFVGIALLIYEAVFMIDGIFITFPDRGIVKLDQYFDAQFGEKRSAALPVSPNPNLNVVIAKYASALTRSATSTMIVYDDNLSLSPKLWLFARRQYYHGITAMDATNFKKMLQSRGLAYFKNYEVYFARATQYTALSPYQVSTDAAEFQKFLDQELNLQPEKVIYGYLNLPMFEVYKFTL